MRRWQPSNDLEAALQDMQSLPLWGAPSQQRGRGAQLLARQAQRWRAPRSHPTHLHHNCRILLQRSLWTGSMPRRCARQRCALARARDLKPARAICTQCAHLAAQRSKDGDMRTLLFIHLAGCAGGVRAALRAPLVLLVGTVFACTTPIPAVQAAPVANVVRVLLFATQMLVARSARSCRMRGQ